MKKNKGFIGIGLILAIILGITVVGGGAYYLNKSSKNISEIDSQIFQNVKLKEYKNIEAGFSFKYPTEYKEVNVTKNISPNGEGYGYSFTGYSGVPGKFWFQFSTKDFNPSTGDDGNTIKKNFIDYCKDTEVFCETILLKNGSKIQLAKKLDSRTAEPYFFGISLPNNINYKDLIFVSSDRSVLVNIASQLEITNSNNLVTTVAPQVVTDCTSSSTPSVKVLSPNGGETYTAGQKVDIKWSSCNSTANDQVMIIMKSTQTLFGAEVATVLNTGTATITLPTSFGGGQASVTSGNYYKMRLELGGNAMNKVAPVDESDNLFTINSATNTILTVLPAKYIGSQNWPPVVKISGSAYSCKISSGSGDVPTVVEEKNINGKKYCKTSFVDAGAGSRFGTYLYMTANGSGSKTASFNLSWSSCEGYRDNSSTGEAEYNECNNTVSTFLNKLDVMVDSLM